MRICDWGSAVCSSALGAGDPHARSARSVRREADIAIILEPFHHTPQSSAAALFLALFGARAADSADAEGIHRPRYQLAVAMLRNQHLNRLVPVPRHRHHQTPAITEHENERPAGIPKSRKEVTAGPFQAAMCMHHPEVQNE